MTPRRGCQHFDTPRLLIMRALLIQRLYLAPACLLYGKIAHTGCDWVNHYSAACCRHRHRRGHAIPRSRVGPSEVPDHLEVATVRRKTGSQIMDREDMKWGHTASEKVALLSVVDVNASLGIPRSCEIKRWWSRGNSLAHIHQISTIERSDSKMTA